MTKILRSQFFYLFLILILAFWVRTYKIDNPVADWHSWRQADTAAVSRNFYKTTMSPGIDKLGYPIPVFNEAEKVEFTPIYFLKMVLVPRYDDMSGVAEKPYPNPNRYRFVEFPFYNLLVYFTYLINGGVNEILARYVSILFSLGSTVFIYFISKQYFGKFTAFVATLLFAVLPFNIYFSRVILPEPSLVFFCLGMFYFVNRWIWENGTNLLILSIIFTAAAFLTKPMAIFYLLPLLYSYYQKEGKWWPIPKRYYLWFIPSILPFLAWRFWIIQHPEGIPASNWLLNGNGIRFRPAFFRWIIGDRFGREILSVAGTFLFFLGLIIKPKEKEGVLMHLLALSSLLYLIVFATGNVQHDYYQTLIIPILVIFVSRGFTSLISGISGFIPRIWTIPLGVLMLILTIYLSWNEVKGLYQINHWDIVHAGKAADRILPKDAVVLAPYQGDTSFLYQTNRPGWPVVGFPVDDLKNEFGVKYYISVNYDDKTNWLIKKFTVIERDPRFVIIDLTREQPDFYQKYKTEEERKEPS